MRFRTCRGCGCPWNRAGNMVCADCHRMLAFARPPRAPRRVVATVPAMALGPASLRVPFGPRAGEPVSSTRLALAQSTRGPALQLCLTLIVLAAAILVVLAVHVAGVPHP